MKHVRSSAILLLYVIHVINHGASGQLRPYNPFTSPDGNVIVQEKIQPTYIVTAPRLIRPDSVYRLSVSLLPESPDLTVKAVIRRDRHQIASGSTYVDSGSSNNLVMKIPPSIGQGEYRLKVEGFDPLHPQSPVFSQEEELLFHSQFLSIVVESNRIVYNNEMKVKFRVILMQMDLKPYTEPVTVFILDPEGYIMRRWPSQYPRNGVVSLAYQLPPFPSKGKWTIRVEALSQVYEQQFFVERYYITFFELIPSGPVYALDTDESYKTQLTTAFHAERVAKGNATVSVYVKAVNSSDAFRFVRNDYYSWVSDFEYEVDLTEVARSVNRLAGSVVRVEFAIRDFFMGETRVGFIETRIIHANLKFRFAGANTAVFKPGMPFTGHIYVMYDDNEPLPPEKLATARLVLRPTATLSNGQTRTLPDIIVPKQGDYLSASNSVQDELISWMERQAEDSEYQAFRTSGVYHFRFHAPKDAVTLRVKATYQDESGDQSSAELQAISYYSPQETYIHVYTSTEEGRIGESAIFHLKSNFAFDRFHYVIISKGAMVHSSQQMLTHATKMTTFAVPISNEMVPTFKVVAMLTNPLGDLIADSVTIPVQSLNRYKMNITLVQARDHSKQTVQLVTRSHPGAFVGVSVLRTVNYQFQAENAISPSRMLKSLYSLEPFSRSVHGVTWTDREGMKADRSQYFTGQNPGPDARRTMIMAGLHIITDARVNQYPEAASCNKSLGMNPCMAVGCFHSTQRCDGHSDCADGSDEDDCPQAPDDKMEFRIFRRNRYHDFYDWLDGDWAWYEIPITDDGEEFHDQPVPATNEAWYVNGFSFHAELGFSMLEEVVEYDGSPPLYFAIEAPSSIRRGEIVGIRMMGINNLNTEMMVLIILEASDDYRFVETGPDGEVEHYNPSLVAGEKHHMVALGPMNMLQVDIPISPQIEQGTITIKITMISQISRQNHEVELEILPEGATISRHTSLMLDLKNRAHLLRFLDIPVEESPIIPYSKFRRFVFGSPKASITLCGDVFGPVFPTFPISTEYMLNRPLRGTEAHLYNLAATLWSLHYLRLTNQLSSDVMYQAFESMNIEMAGLMRLFDHHGSFRLHTNSKPSVWATAWVVRVLGQSQFQDWENNFFVDRKLLSTCVQWLLGYQNEDGTFEETDYYSFPLDRRLSTNSSRSVAHTAHVLIALNKCSDSLQGALKIAVSNAKSRSIDYLQRILNNLKDPYEVAIVTHALTISNSPAKETAFGRLHSIRRENEGMVYWSRRPVPSNNISYENQRPFVQPRTPNQQDAVAVETTAYALLVYLARDGIGDLQERVVTWLNTMRMVEGGFVSIFDSMVAMEALTEYAYRARLRDITDMSIVVEASASADARQVVRIDSSNLASVHKFDVPNVWGHVNVIGRGAGQAVMQLSVQYGIDWEELKDEPSKPYFHLYIDETYSHFRNKSHINVTACVKWLALDEAPHSGAAVLEVEMPSGYGFVQSDGNEVIKKPKYSFLRDVLIAKNKVVWMFDRVGSERLCFDYEIRRWYPVANISLYRSAVIYESYSPEHFEYLVFNATPLYVLDICEVCGSYQCPYCPYFSSAPQVVSHSVFICCLGLYLLLRLLADGGLAVIW